MIHQLFILKQISFRCCAMFIVCASFSLGVHAQALVSKPIQLIFEGSKVFGNQTLLDVATKCRGEQSKQINRGVSDEVVIDYCLHRVKSFMAARGYLSGKVGDPTRTATDAGLIFTVQVDEGALYRLGDVRIDGAKFLDTSQLLKMLNLKSGDIANGEVIREWLFDSVKKAYDNLGYIQYTAEVEPTFHVEADAAEGTVDLAIMIDEGRRFYVSSINLDGNGDVPKALLLAHLLIQNGDVYNSELLKESLKRIDQTKQFDAIDPDKDVDYRSKQDSDQLEITIHLKKKKTSRNWRNYLPKSNRTIDMSILN
jgi:outer membrane protein assembly factor BamA